MREAYRSVSTRSLTRVLGTLLLAAASCLALAQEGSGAATADKLSPALQHQLTLAGDQEPVAAYALLREQADARAASRAAAARGAGKRVRTAAAVRALRRDNTASQAAFLARLARVRGVDNVRATWIVNAVGFAATPEALRAIAADPAVEIVHYDAPWEPEAAAGPTAIANAPTVPGAPEPGLGAINAPALWRMGYTGYGGIAFTTDTGVDPDHPALNHKYAGYGDRPGSWYDLDPARVEPFDCGDHGTHVTGTILGLDRERADTIGVAFNAHWIGAGILCGVGTLDNIRAFEWAIDPDGDPDTDSDRPTVINNSWRDPSVGDIECGTANPYPLVLDNLMAAGISVVFSAGNSGPDAETITPPHNYNAGLVNAFTVGALSGSSRLIADFSSRGPALCRRDSLPLDIKPEVSAPGVSVRSALPGGGYGLKSGTSMASPHVAGAVLLLREAFPELMGEDLQLALYHSAVDLGPAGEDNAYGKGIIDVAAAFDYLVAQGHVPAPPSRPDTAVVVTGIEARSRQCDSAVELVVTLRNEGRVAVGEVTYAVGTLTGATPAPRSLRVDLAPGESREFPVAEAVAPGGETAYAFVLYDADGAALDPALDRGGTVRVAVTDAEPAVVEVQGDPGAVCLGSPLVLGFAPQPGRTVVPHYVASPTFAFQNVRVEPVSHVILPDVRADQTLYATAEYVERADYAAPADPSELLFAEPDEVSFGVTAGFTGRIRSAVIYAEEAHRLRINVYERSSGARAGTVRRDVPAGYSRVALDVDVDEGEQLDFEFRSGDRLGYQPGRLARRQDWLGLLDVDFVSADEPTELPEMRNSSYFLFDIELGLLDGCAPQRVDVAVDSTRSADSLAVAPADPTATTDEALLLTAAGPASAGTRAHRWVLSSGLDTVTAGAALATRVATPGTYTAEVVTLDDAGCQAGARRDFVIEAPVSADRAPTWDADLAVAPNPARSDFAVTGRDRADLRAARLLSVGGEVIRRWGAPDLAAGRALGLSGLAAGVYLVELESTRGARTTRRLSVVR